MKQDNEQQRFAFLLDTVMREGHHLRGTRDRLFQQEIDENWVRALEDQPELAERVDAFAARFGRMQDTLGERLVPSLRRQLLEKPGSALDNLNRLEQLGLLRSVNDWMEARNLRNALVHEYMRDPAAFASALNRAGELVELLTDTYNRINAYVIDRFGGSDQQWPPPLA